MGYNSTPPFFFIFSLDFMIIKPKELDKLSQRYDASIIGFDFCTYNWYFSSYFSLNSSFFKNFFSLLSNFWNSTNSPYINFDYKHNRYKIQKLSFPMGSAFILYSSYLWQEHPYFCWYEYNPENRWALKYDFQILLYGTFFRLNELDSNPHYEEILNDLFDSWFSLSRIDIKNDLFAKDYIPSLVSPFKLLNISRNAPLFLNNVWDNITSWRYWDKKNWRKVIRFYNKFLDIKRVWNQSLYTSAYNYWSFHRLEIQYMYKEVNYIKNIYAFYDFLHKQRLFNLSAPTNIDKIEYLRTNPTQFELQNKLTNIFTTAVKIKLPITEIVFYSLLESWFTDFQRLKNLIDSSSCI